MPPPTASLTAAARPRGSLHLDSPAQPLPVRRDGEAGPHLSTGGGWTGPTPALRGLHQPCTSGPAAPLIGGPSHAPSGHASRAARPARYVRPVTAAAAASRMRRQHRHPRASTWVPPGRGHRARGTAPGPTPGRELGCELGTAPRAAGTVGSIEPKRCFWRKSCQKRPKRPGHRASALPGPAACCQGSWAQHHSFN